MAKRGRLQHAVKAVKQQQKTPKTAPGSKSASQPGSGAPAAKKQKTGSLNSKSNTANQHDQHSKHSKHKKSNGPQQQNQKPTIPFSPTDSILLIGEGDLSFAASLITHHRCTNVTATVLEKDLAELSAKYPHVAANIAPIEQSPNSRLLYGIDARKLPPFTAKPPKSSSSSSSTAMANPGTPTGTMKRIMFNFPHTGGKSTDVNRQVRHNQELLVDFFRGAQRSLAPGGTIIVTLFEGEPYTLWNVRDLARHAGLQVERSFRFVAAVYPGYAHARTLGVVRNKKGEVAGSAWKGETRAARSFVFVRKGEGEGDTAGFGRGKKRRRGDGSDDDESEDEDDELGEADEGGLSDEDGENELDDEEEGEGGHGDEDRNTDEDEEDGESDGD